MRFGLVAALALLPLAGSGQELARGTRYDARIPTLLDIVGHAPGEDITSPDGVVGYVDLEHWLASGTDGEIQAIVESSRVFAPITLDKGRNVGVYAPADRAPLCERRHPGTRPLIRPSIDQGRDDGESLGQQRPLRSTDSSEPQREWMHRPSSIGRS